MNEVSEKELFESVMAIDATLKNRIKIMIPSKLRLVIKVLKTWVGRVIK